MSALVISLDFELFWGVTDVAQISGYGRNVEGVWQAVPAMLELFRRYRVKASWATVGMLMCRDHRQWSDIRPAEMPGYRNRALSNYGHGDLARRHPRLFFARPLVEQILQADGQELASHTYSHFLCGEEGATPAQLSADMACARHVAQELGARLDSLVLPRNQVSPAFLDVLPARGIRVVRGNRDHWMYRDGHHAPAGLAGRAARLFDTWMVAQQPMVGARTLDNGLVDVPASLFLRPWSTLLAPAEPLRLRRLCSAMSGVAIKGGMLHLWWHPHNFGVNLAQNMAMLEGLLRHYARLRDEHGMQSLTMSAFANSQDEAASALQNDCSYQCARH